MKLLSYLSVALLLASIAGCGTDRAQQECRMEKETILQDTHAPPTAIALERIDENKLVTAWSAQGETRYLLIDNNGIALGKSNRVERYPSFAGAPDTANSPKTFWPDEERVSLDAEVMSLAMVDADTVLLAVLEQASFQRRGGAYAILIELTNESKNHVIYLGEVGEFASGIAITVNEDNAFAAWHEGRIDSSLIRTAKIDISAREIVARSIIPNNQLSANPALVTKDGMTMIAWQEILQKKKKTETTVKIALLKNDLALGKQTTVAKCRLLDTSPTLTIVGDKFGLAYRDDADDDDKAEFYFTLITDDGILSSQPIRISRADGYQGPDIDNGDAFVYSAQIRSFQRDSLIGMNRFNLRGEKKGGEFQIYADKAAFIRVALDANGSEILLAYGEDRYGSGRIRSGKIICRDK